MRRFILASWVWSSALGFLAPTPWRPRRVAWALRSAGFEGDPWEILGVARGASKSELRKAFRKKALKTHPDVNPSPEAAAEFSRVQSAYDTVSDAERLRQWERGARGGRAASSAARGGGGGRRPPPGYRPSSERQSAGEAWRPPRPPDYDDAGGDSFGAILGDIFRNVATNPKSTVRAVASDLLDVLEATAGDAFETEFATDAEWRSAVADAESLAERLAARLRDEIDPALVDAKAEERACRADAGRDVDALLAAIEASAGLSAKKTACERQIRNSRRELEALRRRGPPSTAGYDAAPPTSTARRPPPSSAPPPRRPPPKTPRARADPRRVDEELDKLKRARGSPSRSPPPKPRRPAKPDVDRRVDDELDKLKRQMGKKK